MVPAACPSSQHHLWTSLTTTNCRWSRRYEAAAAMAEGHLEGTEVYNLGLSFPLRQKRTKCPWDSFPLRLVWPKLSRRLWAWGRTTSPLAHGNDNPSTQTFWDKEVHENSLSLTVLCLPSSVFHEVSGSGCWRDQQPASGQPWGWNPTAMMGFFRSWEFGHAAGLLLHWCLKSISKSPQ